MREISRRKASAVKTLLRASAGCGRSAPAVPQQGLNLSALACDRLHRVQRGAGVLDVSRDGDRTQAGIFKLDRLMPTYPESQAVKDFRYNAYFGQGQIPKIDGASYRLDLSGLIDSRKPWTLPELYALPQQSQVTRHVCVEGWSMIG
jgi:DMSO/TMAO reductase YedYZ molybdopterin-dependent catalytic subunit